MIEASKCPRDLLLTFTIHCQWLAAMPGFLEAKTPLALVFPGNQLTQLCASVCLRELKYASVLTMWHSLSVAGGYARLSQS